MKRRSFLRNIGLAGLGPLLLNGLPVNAMSRNGALQRMAASSTNGKVLVLIQLHGGNDGLNTLIPINQYDKYRTIRPNIAIPDSGTRKYIGLDSTLGDSQQLGLHPDMESFKSLYDNGMASVIQNVGYENINGSHFRSTDIWFTGSDYDEYLDSGWAGRFLNNTYSNYPEAYPSANMPDPLALEIGSSVSIGFHTDEGIPTAVSVESPEEFYNLLTSVGGALPTEVANSYHGKELKWIMDIEKKSNQYAGRLMEVYRKGRNSTTANYSPIGNLSAQLKVISRLLSGGCQTRIFLARITGFDTHAKQVVASDTTTGGHARLLKQLFDSVRGFQEELKELGLEDKVLTTTFSEFGRRAYSNGSLGTDHGTAAPLFVFGKQVNPGIIGNNADLHDLVDGNIKHEFDFRQVFGTILKDWMGADSSALESSRFTQFTDPTLPILRQQSYGGEVTDPGQTAPVTDFESDHNGIDEVFPNPANTHVDVVYHTEQPVPVEVTLIDMKGTPVVKEIWEPEESEESNKGQGKGKGNNGKGKGNNGNGKGNNGNRRVHDGKQKIKRRLMLPSLASGVYILKWKAGSHQVIKQIIVEQ